MRSQSLLMYIQTDSVRVSLKRLVRSVVTDWRIHAVSGIFLFLIAISILFEWDILLEFNLPLAYSYLFVISLFGGAFPSGVVFWIGYAMFCFLIATILVRLFDWGRARLAATDWRVWR